MEAVEKAIISLCKAAILGQGQPLPENFMLSQVISQVRSHNILPLAYEGALLCGVAKDEPAMRELFSEYCRLYLQSEKQMAELSRVLSFFEQQQIDYLTLKGCRLKFLYPKPELRLMGDADILVRDRDGGFDSNSIYCLMSGLGYRVHRIEEYVLELKHPRLFLELHKNLFSNDIGDLHSYFTDVWSRARREKGHSYSMSNEDEYVYIFAHFAKHYRQGGIGLRQLIDLWVYKRAFPEMNWDYIHTCFEKLNMGRFHDNICRLISFWFEDAPSGEMEEYLSSFIFSSGSWGKLENVLLSSMLRDSEAKSGDAGYSRIRYFLRRFFAPASDLQNTYTILRKAPWLLPVVWLVRGFKKLLFDTHDLIRKSHTISSADEECLKARARELEYVGLNTEY